MAVNMASDVLDINGGEAALPAAILGCVNLSLVGVLLVAGHGGGRVQPVEKQGR